MNRCKHCEGTGLVTGNIAAAPGAAPDFDVCPKCMGEPDSDERLYDASKERLYGYELGHYKSWNGNIPDVEAK